MVEKISGINNIMEALKGKRKVRKIYIQEGRQGKRINDLIKLAERKGVFIQYVEKNRLDKMYTYTNHQGIVAQVDAYEYADLQDIMVRANEKGDSPFILILDGIEDPQNLGSILRSAESAGVHGVIIPRHNSAEITPAVVRASAGAVEHILIARETNLVNCIKKLKNAGLWIIGADMQGENYFTVNIPVPTVLVIGGEGRGLRRLVKENCDLLVKVPMSGQINSLNAGVAAALVMYEVVRQRNPK